MSGEPTMETDPGDQQAGAVKLFATELRKWWSFDNAQQHTHSWHTREDFIANQLPALVAYLLPERPDVDPEHFVE